MTVITATGKEFPCDILLEDDDPERLYVGIVDTPIATVGAVFTDPHELPIEGYRKYTVFCSMNINPNGGVQITLKKGA